MRYVLYFFALIMISSSVSAGVLFPPSGASSNSACPSGQVLGWTGSGIQCQNPTAGVTVSNCPSGTVLRGIKNGSRVCVNPTSSLTVANCSSGTVMRGIKNGGRVCVNPTSSVTVSNCPAGQALRGISKGGRICVSLPKPVDAVCPAGQYVKGIRNGKIDCGKISGGGSSTKCQPGYRYYNKSCYPDGNFRK